MCRYPALPPRARWNSPRTARTRARDLVLHADGDGSSVHRAEILLDKLHVRDAVDLLCRRVLFGIRVVDAVHVLREQQNIRSDLRRAERGARIRGKIGIPRTAGEYDDPPLLEMTERLSQDIGSATRVMVRAVCTRVGIPRFSIASCIARELMTVASIPM